MAAWAQRADITLADKRQRRAVTVQTTAKSLTSIGIATLDGCLAVQAQRADISVANAAPQTLRLRRGETIRSIKIPAINSIARCAIKIPRFVK